MANTTNAYGVETTTNPYGIETISPTNPYGGIRPAPGYGALRTPRMQPVVEKADKRRKQKNDKS